MDGCPVDFQQESIYWFGSWSSDRFIKLLSEHVVEFGLVLFGLTVDGCWVDFLGCGL